ncbi:mannose/fructose/N-acetylgalactosamine-specific phosphotransferase system component IID [Leifsonia sp. AK011]|uniref:hypothetical protein n=1 Tax=Leifsonia sp. AK011 TaxID=2723075 RepID=UPI0015C6D252|nr:hypothetical protein [Leifsonia sp. AK011]NYF09585.1 mannose/fructose/N-acetylgalactosamine-specific phosphotransferase system component IID [Leifsonia sp. AK011]
MVISRATHVAKGLSAAAIATFVALFGHVAGGGDIPGVWGFVAPLVLSAAVCVLIAGRKLSLVRLAMSVLVSQVLFHFLFVLGGSSSGTAVASTHEHHGTTATLVVSHATTSMGVGHVLAAVVTIAALYFGERVIRSLARIVRLLAARMLRPFAVPAPSTIAPAAAVPAAWRIFTPLALDHAASTAPRRGPPAFAA